MIPASDSEHRLKYTISHVIDDMEVNYVINSFEQKVFPVPKNAICVKQNHRYLFYGLTLVANSLQTFDELNLEFGNILSTVAIKGSCYLHRVRYELTRAGKLHLHALLECPPIQYYKDIPHSKGFGRQFIWLRHGNEVQRWHAYICKQMKYHLGELLVDYYYRHRYGFRLPPKYNEQPLKLDI